MKKLLALVLALVMTLSLCTISNAAYSDAADVDYKEAVDVMSAIGVLEGADGKFNPDGILTREQAAKIIAYMLLGKKAADSLSTASAPFTDVAANRWSAGAIAYCASEGIIAGVGNKMFDPTGTLTGYQFSKMLLVALGYDAKIEGMTGADWQINVAKLVIGLKLNDGMTDVALSQGLSRQAAAKLAFNTLGELLVRYTGGVTVDAGNGTSVKVDADLTYTGNTFADVYFADLVDSNPNDYYGRPATKWVWKNQSVGTYPKTPAHVYTSYLGDIAGKKTVKADLGDYVLSAAQIAAGTYASAGKLDTDKIAAVTGNGDVVEIYVESNVITDVVVIDYKVVTVTKVASDKVTLSDGKYVEDDEDLFETVKGFAKGDVLVVYENGTTVVEAYAPTEVTGTLSKFVNAGDATKAVYTLGGTEYKLSAATNADDGNVDATGDLNNNRVLLLDKYGYIVATDTVASSKTYAVVLDAEENSSRGARDWGAKLLFTDGTTKWVDVSKVGSKAVADCSTNDLTALKLGTNKGFVTYKEVDGKYELTAATTASVSTGATITKGTPTFFTSYTATAKTVFVVKTGTGTYKTYTGIKNVPSMTTNGDSYVQYGTGNVATAVYITDMGAAAKDQIFIYNTTSQGTSKDGDTITLNTYKAIVNGEDTTIDIMTTNAGGSAVNGSLTTNLYKANFYDEDGYVTSMGNKITTTSGDFIVATAAAGNNNPFVNVTLNGEVLSIVGRNATNAADEVKATKVIADGFKAWMVDLTAGNASVDEVTLDDENTVADMLVYNNAAWTLADGDYVLYVLDSDGFVTDLYLVNIG